MNATTLAVSAPSSTPPRRLRTLAPWLLLAPLAAVALLRLVAHDAWLPLAWINSLTMWLYLPAWPLAVHALVRRRAASFAVAAFVCACHLAWVAPTLIARADAPPADAPRVCVVTANLLYVNPRADELLGELLALEADVLVLEELSPEWLVRLAASPLWDRYPHRELEARSDAFGIAVLSRRPMTRAEIVDLEGVPMIDATIDVDGRALRLLAVHTLPPIDGEYAAVWRRQLARLAFDASSNGIPLVIAGDLNASNHSAGLVALRDAGLRDAHAELGRGLVTTWPNGVFLAPPLHLDHVLVSEHVVPVAITEGMGAGSDHRPVIADLALVAR